MNLLFSTHPGRFFYAQVVIVQFSCIGQYWIDPNGGAIEDAVLVECNFEKNSTCFPAKAKNVGPDT